MMEKENKLTAGRGVRDMIYSISATAFFNMIIQLVLYPFMARRLGDEGYGLALAALSFVAISAGTVGTAANYSRMVSHKALKPTNGDYNIIMLAGGILCGVLGVGYLAINGMASPVVCMLFALLLLLTAFRYYSDVDFRLSSNFFRYMVFYVIISLGYVLGLAVFALTGEWMWALIVGEALGVGYVVLFGTIYRSDLLRKSRSFKPVCASMGLILLSTLIENLALNSDRLLLAAFESGTAAAIYYTASLFGKVVAMLTVPINSLIISYLVKLDVRLSPRFWRYCMIIAVAVGGVAFGGCVLVSPLFLRLLYPDLYEAARPYIASAILGQIFYFISNVLVIILLKFRGEKKQFAFNVIYAVEFFALTVPCTVLWGLNGFVWSSLGANALRFLMVAVWGAVEARNDKKYQEAGK